VDVNVDENERGRAVARTMTLLTINEQRAAALVDAVVAGAVAQALELINGSGPVPTTMVTARADQVRFICDRAGRILTQREIEVLLRITGTAARGVINTMNATYAEALRNKRLDWMRNDATVSSTGSIDSGLSWTLRFTEESTLDEAWTELQRIGIAGQSQRDMSQMTVTFPQQALVDGLGVDALKQLGLTRPKQRSKR
jgi:hypothetical protein